jgi:hypothetical protein
MHPRRREDPHLPENRVYFIVVPLVTHDGVRLFRDGENGERDRPILKIDPLHGRTNP